MKQSVTPLNLYDKELVDELEKFSHVPDVREAGFGVTVAEYMTARKISETTAKRHLRDMVKLHGWKMDKMRVNGCLVNVYHK